MSLASVITAGFTRVGQEIKAMRGTKQSATSTATLAPVATDRQLVLTAQAAALAVSAPTGSPQNGDKMLFAVKDNGTARAITWNAIYVACGSTPPATTVAGKWVYVGFIYNTTASKYHCVEVSQES